MKSGSIIPRPAAIINSIVRTNPSCTPSFSFHPSSSKAAEGSFVSRSFRNHSPLNSFFNIAAHTRLWSTCACVPFPLTRSSLNFITRSFCVQYVVVHFTSGSARVIESMSGYRGLFRYFLSLSEIRVRVIGEMVETGVIGWD